MNLEPYSNNIASSMDTSWSQIVLKAPVDDYCKTLFLLFVLLDKFYLNLKLFKALL